MPGLSDLLTALLLPENPGPENACFPAAVHIFKKEAGGLTVMTPFDEAILPGELKMFKAFLPFLPANLQKMCAIYIKWLELKATIDYYDQHPPVQEPADMSHVFRHLKGILPPEEQASMEQLADMMENMDLYRSMFESFSAPTSSDQKRGDNE